MPQNISNYPYLNKNYNYQSQNQPNFTADGKPAPIYQQGVVQNNPLLNAATSEHDNPLQFLAAAGISTAGLMTINNFINNPLITKDYNSTIFKKIETVVDKFAGKPVPKSILNKLGATQNWLANKASKSRIVETLLKKPSIGGSMVQSQAAGAKGHLASRALKIMKKYKEQNPAYTGFDAILKKAEKESYKYYDEIIKTIKNSGVNRSQVMTSKPWWGFGVIKNKGSLQEILNKDILIQNYKSAGKTLGQKVSGYLMRSGESLTNGLFSGKGAVLFQALIIAQSINEASKAEKGEKFSTFMASLSELMAFMATMGIQMRVVNSIGGLKYMGMTPMQVKRYKVAMKLANKAAKTKNLAEYTRNTNIINNLKHISNGNIKWYQKPLKWIGDFITIGRINETLKPLKASKIATTWAKIPYGLKVGLGYAGRVAFIIGVIIPIFSGIAKNISYKIFGKPTKTLEREKTKEESEKAQANAIPQEIQAQQATPKQVPQGPVPHGDLVDKMLNPQQYQQPVQQPMQQPIAAQTMQPAAAAPISKTPEQNAGISRSYVPNPILGEEKPINPASTRSAAIEAALRKADWAEAQAQKYL